MPICRSPRGGLRERDPRAGEIGAEGDAVGARRVGHDRALGARVEAGLGLEGDGAGEDAPVDLGQGDVHRDVARGEPLRARRPALLVAAREHDLEHGTPAGVEGSATAFRSRSGDREAGGVQHQAHVGLLQHPPDEVRRDRILEARDEERQRVHAARRQRIAERVDGSEVGRLQVGAVEDDGGGGRARGPRGRQLLQAAHARTRPVEAGPGQGSGLPPLARAADQVRREGEQVSRVLRSRVHAVLPQAVGGLGRRRAERDELRVGLIVAGQERERDRGAPAGLDDLLHPVGPVAGAPEHPRHHQLRARHHRVDVGVHRERVGELHEVGEAQRGEGVAEARPRVREARELGVRGGEEHDVPRSLAEIDRLRLVERRARLRLQQVHSFRRRGGAEAWGERRGGRARRSLQAA